jgi:AraC family transcriptional regulator
MRKVVFFVFSSMIVFSITLFFRLGGHKDVLIEVGEYPEMKLGYKDHYGPYHKINSAITFVENWAKSQNISCEKTFGEYFDDPRSVEERRLRSIGGCILNTKIVPTEFILYKEIPKRTYVKATFAGAPSIGPFKVYPKVEEYIKSHNLNAKGAPIEVYTIHSTQAAVVEYYFPIEK